jgi:hypothetical protein
VNHFTRPSFWDFYAKLPSEIQVLADKNYQLLKENPRHPSLQLKQIGRLWSVRITDNYRALGLDSNVGIVWFWIGQHGEYEKLLKR